MTTTPKIVKFVEYVLNYKIAELRRNLDNLAEESLNRHLKLNYETTHQLRRYCEMAQKINDQIDIITSQQPLIQHLLKENPDMPEKATFVLKYFISHKSLDLDTLQRLLKEKNYPELESKFKQLNHFYHGFKSNQYQGVKVDEELFQLLQVFRIEAFIRILQKRVTKQEEDGQEGAINEDKENMAAEGVVDQFFE
ncbi:Hypothetical_protein [Hexamita inflata]|uniref:Hypothetical_protein n=1 Tax=Hexamita inflata TaxID=28002 RepID=A0AA86TKT7_9EUKA|nr:Hypothetical protein HINF_LOCUS8040 [Hexamita inflata]